MTVYEKFINERYINLFNTFLNKVVEPRLRKEIHATIKLKLKLYGISIQPKSRQYANIPIEELTDQQANVYFFIDLHPNISIRETTIIRILSETGSKILGLKYENFYNYVFRDEEFRVIILINERPNFDLDYQSDEPLNEDVEPSRRAIKNVCDSEKFCKAQGKITFGQLKAIFESATRKRIFTHLGVGGYKATLRLIPWFLPQLLLAGAVASITRAVNKIVRPALEDTTTYKTWWGKMTLKAFDVFEGELNIEDPLSKIFFISDGLLTMIRENDKVQFAKYIANIASEKSEGEEVSEYFVENELRDWLNKKYLLNPPLNTKNNESNQLNESQYDYEDSEKYYEKIDNLLNRFLKTTGKEKDIPNFIGYKVISGKDRYSDFTIKLIGLFKEPYSGKDSDKIHEKSRKMTKLIRDTFPFLSTATFYGGSTTTIDSYEKNLEWEKSYLNRKIKKDDDLPFDEVNESGIKTRLFKESVDNQELKWHFDEQDRKVKVVKSNGWEIQMDNEIPRKLTEGDTLFIPKGVYHRIIKGNGDLIVKIKEY